MCGFPFYVVITLKNRAWASQPLSRPLQAAAPKRAAEPASRQSDGVNGFLLPKRWCFCIGHTGASWCFYLSCALFQGLHTGETSLDCSPSKAVVTVALTFISWTLVDMMWFDSPKLLDPPNHTPQKSVSFAEKHNVQTEKRESDFTEIELESPWKK